ncbi:MAG: hypothetical protein ACYSU4_16305 [Planctomycetota bacterium]
MIEEHDHEYRTGIGTDIHCGPAIAMAMLHYMLSLMHSLAQVEWVI